MPDFTALNLPVRNGQFALDAADGQDVPSLPGQHARKDSCGIESFLINKNIT